MQEQPHYPTPILKYNFLMLHKLYTWVPAEDIFYLYFKRNRVTSWLQIFRPLSAHTEQGSTRYAPPPLQYSDIKLAHPAGVAGLAITNKDNTVLRAPEVASEWAAS